MVAGWVSEATWHLPCGECSTPIVTCGPASFPPGVCVGRSNHSGDLVERVGHVNWILDDRIDAQGPRAARAGLEFAACLFMYRESLSDLDADKSNSSPSSRLEGQGSSGRLLKTGFRSYQPPQQTKIATDTSPPTGDVTRWTVNGESFSFAHNSNSLCLGIRWSSAPEISKGTYGGLSGFSQPRNVAFSRERRDIRREMPGSLSGSSQEEMEKCARMALLRFAVSVKKWVTYYQAEVGIGSPQKLDDVTYRLEVLCDATRRSGRFVELCSRSSNQADDVASML